MAKYKFKIEEDVNLFGMKELLKFLISHLDKTINLEIDDTVEKIPNNIKKHFKKSS